MPENQKMRARKRRLSKVDVAYPCGELTEENFSEVKKDAEDKVSKLLHFLEEWLKKRTMKDEDEAAFFIAMVQVLTQEGSNEDIKLVLGILHWINYPDPDRAEYTEETDSSKRFLENMMKLVPLRERTALVADEELEKAITKLQDWCIMNKIKALSRKKIKLAKA